MSNTQIERIVAVALNPAIDRVLEVPALTLGAHQVARLLARYPAGKAVNVAKDLSLLAVPCELTGLVGQGDLEYYARDVADHLIRMEMLPVAGSTRENITLVDPIARNETHIRDRGFVVTSAELDSLRRKLVERARDGTVFAFSGSLPQGIGPEQFADLLALCRKGGASLAVDASGPALAAAVEARPWLIKPNREELEELLGRTLHGAEQLLAAGRAMTRQVEVVLVSCGQEGAYLFAGGAVFHGWCAVPREEVASTVGCGDALLAGFLGGLHKGLDMPGALKLAVAAAAASAMSLTTLFERQQVDALLAQTRVVSAA